jgi:hypothetical protein
MKIANHTRRLSPQSRVIGIPVPCTYSPRTCAFAPQADAQVSSFTRYDPLIL